MTISRTAVAKVIRKIMTETSRESWPFNVNSTHHFTGQPNSLSWSGQNERETGVIQTTQIKEIKNVS